MDTTVTVHNMSNIKLVIGKLQERLVKKFTVIEVVTLTVWFYLALIGAELTYNGIVTSNMFNIGSGVLFSVGSIIILYLGLHREHDVATQSGNVGPNAE